MKIIIAAKSAKGGVIGGGVIYISNLIRALCEDRHHVLVFCDSLLVRYLKRRYKAITLKGYLFSNYVPFFGHFLSFVIFILSIPILIRHIIKFKPHILLTNVGAFSPGLYIVHRLLRTPIVLYKANLLNTPTNALSDKIYGFLEKVVLKCLRFDAIVSCSKLFANDYRALGGKSPCFITSIPAWFSSKEKSKQAEILFKG